MSERGVRRKMTGIVVGDKMDKTAVVLVSRLKKHQAYKKYVTAQVRHKAHDPQNICRVGDKVRIVESRPVSKTKRWRVVEVLERAAAEGVEDRIVDLPEQAK